MKADDHEFVVDHTNPSKKGDGSRRKYLRESIAEIRESWYHTAPVPSRDGTGRWRYTAKIHGIPPLDKLSFFREPM